MESLTAAVSGLRCAPEVIRIARNLSEKGADVTELATAVSLIVKELGEIRPNSVGGPDAALSDCSQAASPGTSNTPKDRGLSVVAKPVAAKSSLSPAAATATASNFAFEIPNVQMLSPRGRHAVRITATEMQLHGPRNTLVIVPLEKIKHTYNLPKVDNYGKVSADLWVLVLTEAVQSGKQLTSTIVFQTKPVPKPVDPNSARKTPKPPPTLRVDVSAGASMLPENCSLLSSSIAASEGSSTLEGTMRDLISACFHCGVFTSHPKAPSTPDNRFFQSSRNSPVVKCYVGVNDGILYPLPDGVFFLGRPYTFVSLDEMAGLECAKGGSGRTLDLIVTLHEEGEPPHEFSMIEKEEASPLNVYIQHMLRKAQRLAREAGLSGDGGNMSSDTGSVVGSRAETKPTGKNAEEAVVLDDLSSPEDDESDDDDSDFDVEEAKRERREERRQEQLGDGADSGGRKDYSASRLNDHESDSDSSSESESYSDEEDEDQEGSALSTNGVIEIDARNMVGIKRKASPAITPAAVAPSALNAETSSKVHIVLDKDSETESEDDLPVNVPAPSEPKAKKMKFALGGAC